MADGCVSTSSVIKSSKNYFLECDLDEILRYKDAKCFAYHGNRIKWTDSFEMLKLFIKCAIEQAGTWMSSGGKYKKFTSSSSDLILTWNYGLCTLSFRGEEGARLKELLIHVCTMEKNLPADIDLELASNVCSSTPIVQMVVDDQPLLASADQEGGITLRKVNVEKAPVVDALELSALEQFIDCSFQNVCISSCTKSPSKMGQAVDSFTPLRQIDNDNLSPMKACLSTFKSHVELELGKLSTRLSIQNQIINANKQELDRLIAENLHLKSRIGELENRAPSQYEGPVNTVHIEVRKENQASADNNDDSSNTCPCYNAPQLVESTSTMPPTTCQNQQQVSNTDRSHLNDGDLIPQSTDCDTNQQRENSSLNLDLPIKDLIHAHSQEENTTSSSAVIMRNPTNWLNYLPFCEVPLLKHEKLSNFQSDKINPQLSDCCPLSTPPSEKIDVKKRGANKGKLSFPSRKNKTCTKKSERHHSDRSPFHRGPTNHAPVMHHPNSLPPYQIHQLRKLHIPSYQPHRLNISPPYLPPCQKELPPYYPSPPMRSREWLDYLDIVHQVTRIL